MIRGIRVISGQLNIIHTRIYFFRTLIERIKQILQVRFTCFPKDHIYMYARQQHITRKSESQQPQAVTLANPFRIPMNRKKTKVKKRSVVKDSVCILLIRERFFDLRTVAEGSQDEL